MKIKFIWLALTVSLLVNYAVAQKVPVNNKAERPNIVLIFADDMGFNKLLI